MTPMPKRFAALAVAVLAAAGLAACGKSSSPAAGPTNGPPSTPTGTLKIVAAGGPDHIDTVPAYYTGDYILEHGYTRQLLTYPYAVDPTITSAGWKKATTPVPDIATAVPTTANGGITNGGKTYTFHIKQGVTWNTSPPRQVTASDFIREFKAFFNPVSPVGNGLYYTSTIAGLLKYQNQETAYFAVKSHKPTATNIANKSITQQTNPAWKQSTDSNRHQYVKTIVETLGVASAATQLADQQAGTQDIVGADTPMQSTAIQGLISKKDPKFKVWPWSSTFPYVVFNLRSPNSGGVMKKLGVRQAIEYGINKVAVQKVYGGPAVSQIINTAIPPGNTGYVNYNLYPDNNGNGDTAKCKSTLAAAGYPHGLTLTYLYQNDSINTQAFVSIQASLKSCGITLKGKGEPGSSFYVDLGNSPENAKPGTWDLGQGGWIPDWFGNNGRTVISPLFETNCVINTTNYGCYNSTALDNLIKQAEAATSLSAAGAIWHKADENVMKNAVFVPLLNQLLPYYSSKRVQNAGSSSVVYGPNYGPDITNMWLNPSS